MTKLVMNTETGRVFPWTAAIAERPNVRLLPDGEAETYLKQATEDAKAQEAVNPTQSDQAQAMTVLAEMLKGMTTEAIAQFVQGVAAQSNVPTAPAAKRGRPSKSTDAGESGESDSPGADGNGGSP